MATKAKKKTARKTTKKAKGRPRTPAAEAKKRNDARNKAQRERRARNRKMVADAKKHAKSGASASAKRDSIKSAAGMPAFEPTTNDRKQVEVMAGLGLKREEICLLVDNPRTGLPINEKTLAEHFDLELRRGAPKAAAIIGQSIFSKAQGNGPGAITAAIWFSKCRMGWKERVALDVDIKSGVLVSPITMTPEQWVEAAQLASVDKPEPGAEVEA